MIGVCKNFSTLRLPNMALEAILTMKVTCPGITAEAAYVCFVIPILYLCYVYDMVTSSMTMGMDISWMSSTMQNGWLVLLMRRL